LYRTLYYESYVILVFGLKGLIEKSLFHSALWSI